MTDQELQVILDMTKTLANMNGALTALYKVAAQSNDCNQAILAVANDLKEKMDEHNKLLITLTSQLDFVEVQKLKAKILIAKEKKSIDWAGIGTVLLVNSKWITIGLIAIVALILLFMGVLNLEDIKNLFKGVINHATTIPGQS